MQVGLLTKKNARIVVVETLLSKVEKDLDSSVKKDKFQNIFFEAYNSIFKKQENVPIVDIPDIRTAVSTAFYIKHNLIVTEKQFDEMLRGIKLATDEYIISLGRAMGAEEKLLKFEQDYYRTISVRFLK